MSVFNEKMIMREDVCVSMATELVTTQESSSVERTYLVVVVVSDENGE